MMTTTTTTTEPKELVFQTCKDFIKANNRGPRISVIEEQTGLTQPRVSYYMGQLKKEGRVDYEAGNYESMQITQRLVRRKTKTTTVTVVERRRSTRAIPDRAEVAESAVAASRAGFALKAELIRVCEERAKELAAFDLVLMLKPEAEPADLLTTPSQAVKDELQALRNAKQKVLDAYHVVIASLE